MGHPVFIEPYEIDQEELYFSLNETGGLVLYGNQSVVGTHGFSITAYDVYEECPFSAQEIYVVRIIDINDPPHMKGILEDIELWEGTERSPFALNEYFDDVDVIYEWKTLIYEALPAGGEGTMNVEVTIDPSTTIVTFRSPRGNCETDEIFIKAEDLGGLSISSNVFRVESLCLEREEIPPDRRDGPFERCEPEWKCDVWSECYPNGTQVRSCTDINRCEFDDFIREVWRECDYDAPVRPDVEEIIDPEATCFDGIRNCHVMENGFIICEEGVDCGGPCDPCERLETPGIIKVEESDNFMY